MFGLQMVAHALMRAVSRLLSTRVEAGEPGVGRNVDASRMSVCATSKWQSCLLTDPKMRLCFLLVVSVTLLQAQDPLVDGLEAFRSGRTDDAIAAFQQAVDLNPANKNARLYLASAFMIGKAAPDLQRAEDQLRSVLAIDASNTMALGLLGKLHYRKMQLGESRRWYERLIQADPLSKDAFYSLGVIAWTSPSSADVIEEGIRNLDTALEIDPNFSAAVIYHNLLNHLR